MENTKWKKVKPNLGEQVPVWKPQEAEELIGKLTDIEKNVGANNATLLTFENQEGKKVKVWQSTSLSYKMEGILIGETIKIAFLGLKTNPKNGREYRDYEVFREELDGDLN